MLKKIQRRASRINFLQKKIIIVIEIEKCEWNDYDENVYSNNNHHQQTPPPPPLTSASTNSNQLQANLTVPSSSSGTLTSSPLHSPPPSHALSPQALYNTALAPFYPVTIPIGSMMSLSIDKSGKYFATTDQELSIHSSFMMENPLHNRESKEKIPKLAIVQWHHEIIECNGTLYYNPKIHRFQEKMLTINLKMKKKQEKDKERDKDKDKDKEKDKDSHHHHNQLHNSLFSVVTSFAGRDQICYTVGRFSVPLHEIIHEQLIANNTLTDAPPPPTSLSHSSLNLRPSITTDSELYYPSDKRRIQSSNVSLSAESEDEADSDEAIGAQDEGSDTGILEDGSFLEGVAYESQRSSFTTNKTLPMSNNLTKEVKSVAITSWNDIEKNIRIPLTEQPNIILHGRILIKFLPDPMINDYSHSHSHHKIDNYLPKFMLLRQVDSDDEDDQDEKEKKKREEERERERERAPGGGGVYQIVDEDHLFDHHHGDYDENDSDDDGFDHLSTISSLTSASPHVGRRKRLIKDIFTAIPGSHSSSFLHHQKLSASFPTQFFKKVKERLQTPRNSNNNSNPPPAVLEKQMSRESNNSSDSSQYGPTSYPQPTMKSNNIAPPQKLRKPSVIISEEAQRSQSPTANKGNTQQEKEKGKDESQATVNIPSRMNPREKMTRVWFQIEDYYLTHDGIALLIVTIIALIVVAEYVRRNFTITPLPPPTEGELMT